MNFLSKAWLIVLPTIFLHSANANALADQRLNQTYQKAMETLTKTQQTALRDAQRAWLNYRDVNCKISNELLKEDTSACQTRLAHTQIKNLESLITGKDIFTITEQKQTAQQDLALTTYGEVTKKALTQLQAEIRKINSTKYPQQFSELERHYQNSQKLYCLALTEATAIYPNNCAAQFTLGYMSDVSNFLPNPSMQNILYNFVNKGVRQYKTTGTLSPEAYRYRRGDTTLAEAYYYFDERYGLDLLEKLSGQSIYITSPHKNFELTTGEYTQMGRYNPRFLQWVHQQLKLVRQNQSINVNGLDIPEHIRETVHLYLFTGFQLQKNPKAKEALITFTEKMICTDKDDFYDYLDQKNDHDLGRLRKKANLFVGDEYSPLHAMRFWGRRGVDGTDQLFFDLLVELFEIIEPQSIQQIKSAAQSGVGTYQAREDR